MRHEMISTLVRCFLCVLAGYLLFNLSETTRSSESQVATTCILEYSVAVLSQDRKKAIPEFSTMNGVEIMQSKQNWR